MYGGSRRTILFTYRGSLESILYIQGSQLSVAHTGNMPLTVVCENETRKYSLKSTIFNVSYSQIAYMIDSPYERVKSEH